MSRIFATSWMTFISLLLAVACLAQAGKGPASSGIEIRVDVSANSDSGPTQPCEVVQASSGSPVLFWSTYGEVTAGSRGELEVVGASGRCGGGAFTGPSALAAPESGRAPLVMIEASATPKWDPGPMDPGPVPVVQIILSLSSRRLTGFSADGKPLYGDPTKDLRNVRLGEEEEFIWPVFLPAPRERQILGAHEVLVRVRAALAGNPGASEYGTLEILAAAPDTEIIVDGGVAGHTGSDGSARLQNTPVGQREVRIRGASNRSVARFPTVVRGRTVVLSPQGADGAAKSPAVFSSAGTNPQGFPEFRRTRDGAVMVQIPEGEFVMGNLETEGKPQPHPVYVSSFLMDKLPVTWGQFRRFAAETGRPMPPEPYWGIQDDHPVSFVRWDEGRAYCEWAGARLPTEAEREKAARGTDGRKFPWGNEEPSPLRGVFRRDWGYEGTDSVGIRPAGASPYGLLDTGGNVWEWCQDWYDPEYYRSSLREDPMGPRTGRAHVVRGGSWDSRPSVLSASCRNWGYVGYREGDFGFRCAADLR